MKFKFIDEEGKEAQIDGLKPFIELIKSGKIKKDTLLFEEQNKTWKQASEYEEYRTVSENLEHEKGENFAPIQKEKIQSSERQTTPSENVLNEQSPTGWCPKCGSEYKQGVQICADCDVPLVEEKPEYLETDSVSEIKWCPKCKKKETGDIDFCTNCRTNLVSRAPSQIRPWVRYWARYIDYICFSFVGGFILGILFPSFLELPELVIGMFFIFVWCFVEPILLSTWGTTFGKWLLRIKVRDLKGDKLLLGAAFRRSFYVFAAGIGLGIPIVSFFALIGSYNDLTRKGTTSWDREAFVVSHTKIGVLRALVAILFFVGVAMFVTWSKEIAPN